MNIILVDDESLALDYLESLLRKVGSFKTIKKFDNPLLAKEAIVHEDVDVVFLDINLPEINGIELAEMLIAKKPNLTIIFCTAYEEYAVQAFEINALDYIVKPVSIERLTKTMNRIQKQVPVETNNSKVDDDGFIYMNMFQTVSIQSKDRSFLTISWRTKKAEELFLYLLQHRNQLIHKSILVDTLWPEHDEEKVYNQLYTAVYYVRKKLKDFGEHFQLKNTSDGYILTLINVTLDVEEWETRYQAAPPLQEETINYYTDLLTLYNGDFLQEYDYWWAESKREKYKQWWLLTIYKLAHWHEEHQQFDKAVLYFSQIVRKYPEEEVAYFHLMKLYDANGHHLLVNQHYETLATFLQAELNTQPSSYITEWYLDFKKEQKKTLA
ncbi:response regulator [Bacillus sp. FJAT-42315]|uniref:response regulator n=1 Tax=Bacillus sp. FJAT-42315 TaxID=2014077 RepID=UPI000C24DC32|nr:response regulator [Bacillus sp. FJAT-42315]